MKVLTLRKLFGTDAGRLSLHCSRIPAPQFQALVNSSPSPSFVWLLVVDPRLLFLLFEVDVTDDGLVVGLPPVALARVEEDRSLKGVETPEVVVSFLLLSEVEVVSVVVEDSRLGTFGSSGFIGASSFFGCCCFTFGCCCFAFACAAASSFFCFLDRYLGDEAGSKSISKGSSSDLSSPKSPSRPCLLDLKMEVNKVSDHRKEEKVRRFDLLHVTTTHSILTLFVRQLVASRAWRLLVE
jgi:hypothetical protein